MSAAAVPASTAPTALHRKEAEFVSHVPQSAYSYATRLRRNLDACAGTTQGSWLALMIVTRGCALFYPPSSACSRGASGG